MLFENKKRTDLRPANHLDDDYKYYDRSAKPMFGKIRNLLNSWFDNYPEEHQQSLKTGFKNNFQAAFFELFIHELFKKQGFKLIPHPNVEGTTKQPDFLVSGNSIEFYLEAKHASDLSEQNNSVDKRKSLLYDEINKIESPDFFLHINELRIKTEQQPSAKKIIQHIKNDLLSHNHREVKEIFEKFEFDQCPKIKYSDDKVDIVISILPKVLYPSDKVEDRAIGVYPVETTWGGAQYAIKKAIINKAGRYGNLNLPYLICINSTSRSGTDTEDVFNALFGSSQISLHTYKSSRAYDGVFINSKGPIFTRVSGILVTNVYPSNLHIANHWLVKHPFASRELNFDSINLSRIEVLNNKIESIEGYNIKDILGISDDWFIN